MRYAIFPEICRFESWLQTTPGLQFQISSGLWLSGRVFSVSSFLIAPIKPENSPREITGVSGAEISIAVLKAPGHKIELLEYHAPPERKQHIDLRPCDVGSVHVALTVDNLDAVLERIAASGWKAAGKPQTLKAAQTPESASIYVRDPDGTTIEFMQPPQRLISN